MHGTAIWSDSWRPRMLAFGRDPGELTRMTDATPHFIPLPEDGTNIVRLIPVGNDAVLAFMVRHKIRLTRESYLSIAYFGAHRRPMIGTLEEGAPLPLSYR
jgi:hypothetical protein